VIFVSICFSLLHICYLPVGRSVLGGTVLETKGTVFPNMDQPRPANNVFIFFSVENYFIRNIFVDFLLQQFYTVRVRLTFRSIKPVLFTEVFKRRDSVFADFRTEQ